MIEKIERYLKELIVALQIAKIYTSGHPKFSEFLNQAHKSLTDILGEKEKFTIGIIGEELAFEKEIFFELSKRIKAAILLLKEKGVERITFVRGVGQDELVKFIEYLTTPQQDSSQDVQAFLSISGIKNISVGKIQTATASGKAQIVKSCLQSYQESLGKVSQATDNVLSGNKIDYIDLRFSMIGMMENLINRYNEFLKLITVKRYDNTVFCHLINVSILSMYFSWKLGFSKEDFLDIATAAIFHDIGKIFISRRIIQKPGKLSEGEFNIVRSHAALGAQILLKYSDTLGVIVPLVAFEHHLRYDLKGYPKLRFRQRAHIASLIVSICDVYDALIQRRSYKNEYSPDLIYEIMMKEKGGLFHPGLLDDFFKIMGVWPQGTILLLDNGSVSIVREQNIDDEFHPIVEVISLPGDKTFINLKERKDIKIKNFLSPLSNGKKYLEFV